MINPIVSGSCRLSLAVVLCLGMAGCMSGPQAVQSGPEGAGDDNVATDASANPAGAAARLVAPDTDSVKRKDIIAQCQMLEAPENAECEARAYDGFEHKTDIEDPLP